MVTEAVISKREQIAQDVAANQLAESAANIGSSNQLNTGKYLIGYKFHRRPNDERTCIFGFILHQTCFSFVLIARFFL